MSDPQRLRDPALGGDPALDPVVPGPRRRSAVLGGPWWLLAILIALLIAAGIWGYGGGFGRRGAGVGNGTVNGGPVNGVPVNGDTTSGGTPVFGGAAPTNAPAPAPPGNGSGR